jgi:hypothetical protein
MHGGVDPMGLRGADPKYWAERGEREKERARRDEERKRREGTGERNFLKIFWDEYFLSKYEEDKQANLDSGRGMNEFCAGTLAFLDTAPVFSTGSRGAEALHGERLQGVDYGEPLSGTERALEGGEFLLSAAGPAGRILGSVDEVVDVAGVATKVDNVDSLSTYSPEEVAKLRDRLKSRGITFSDESLGADLTDEFLARRGANVAGWYSPTGCDTGTIYLRSDVKDLKLIFDEEMLHSTQHLLNPKAFGDALNSRKGAALLDLEVRSRLFESGPIRGLNDVDMNHLKKLYNDAASQAGKKLID